VRLRKLIIGVAAVGMPLTVMSTVIGVGAAWAVTGTGNYSCTKVTGTITFKPALKNGGTSAETTTIATTASTCTGGSPKPTKVTGKATIKTSTNSCSNLANPQTVTLTLTNTPAVSPKSVLHATSSEVVTTKTITFDLTGTVSGSYVSSSASGSGLLTQTPAAVAKSCASSTGLTKVTIKSGKLTNF